MRTHNTSMDLDAGAAEWGREKLNKALAAKDSKEALKICEDFEMQHCGTCDPAVALPFYRIQLIAYLMHDLVNARWLWERAPAAVQGDEDMSKIWELAKLLWKSDMSAAYAQLASAEWKDSAVQTMAAQLIENVRSDTAALVAKSHSTITINSCSQLLGLTREQTVARCHSIGWGIEGDFIKPVRSAAVVSHVINSDQLQALTDYVCSLDTK